VADVWNKETKQKFQSKKQGEKPRRWAHAFEPRAYWKNTSQVADLVNRFWYL